MSAWHRGRRADLALRALGLGLCATALLICEGLVSRSQAVPQTTAVAFVLAAVAFLSGSAGSAITLRGNHLFDEVEVSERWRPRPIQQRSGDKPSLIKESWTATNRNPSLS